jgi:hypothetical protein
MAIFLGKVCWIRENVVPLHANTNYIYKIRYD